jgi:hypothetical protein
MIKYFLTVRDMSNERMHDTVYQKTVTPVRHEYVGDMGRT